jgi:hypothetical protein
MEALAEHEDRGHHDRGLAAEARQRPLRREEARRRQGDDDQHSHQIVAQLLGDEERERQAEEGEEDECGAGRPPTPP